MEDKTSPQSQPDDAIEDAMVSSSPDSGLCDDLDLKSPSPSDLDPKTPSPKKDRLLDPLQDRRLTLLKSLSQDSEYSLDTSLFDAEEFLQDMGFAGGRDPTIPDRFLPSLMQRLARFPESEMESLHDRIIQSIGCFRRKEGKRRLFRNLSMGKDPRRQYLLGCPSTTHPLLRSNTDPTTFPYEETSSATSSSSLLQSSSSSSRLHSLGSSKDDSEFPESPITILVSAASVDQDQREDRGELDQRDVSSDLDQHVGPVISERVQTGASSDLDQRDVSSDLEQHDASEVHGVRGDQDVIRLADAESQPNLEGGDEFANTVEGIRKLTKEISVQDEDDASKLDNDVYQPDDVSRFYDDDPLLDEELSQIYDASKPDDYVFQTDGFVSGLDDDVFQPKEGFSEIDYGTFPADDGACKSDSDGSLHDNYISQTDVETNLNGLLVKNNKTTLSNSNNQLSEAKRGFEESTNFTFSESDITNNFNSLKLIDSGVLNKHFSESQEKNGMPSNTKSPLRRTSNAIFYNPKSLKTFVNPQYEKNMDGDSLKTAVKETFGIENGQYSIESEDSNVKLDELERALNGDTIFDDSVKPNGYNELRHFQNDTSINALKFQTNQFIKPKYSRGDSLTNFLSSMLDTSDISSSRPSIPIPSPFSDKNCNSDSEMAGSFASSPFIAFRASDTKSKNLPSENSKTIQTTFSPLKNLKVKESNDKAPNRKRRVLRRMSSSLQCCDDVNCKDSNGLKVDGLRSEINTPATTLFLETKPAPKQNLESIRPVPSNHRVVHSCNSLPVSNMCSSCNTGWETDKKNDNTNNCQTQISRNCCGDCHTKKEKSMSYIRKCKRRRNLSCPFPELSLNHSACYKPKAVQCDCMTYKHTPNVIENNRHTSLVLPCNLSQNEACSSCRCFNESLNYRLNLCCASSQSNIFHSLNTEHWDSNVRCFGPPSPSLLQPSNNVFAFGPNLGNQNRHLCYSSPDLSQECCSNQFEHCRQRSFTNVDECSFNSTERRGPRPFRGDNHFTDEVFFKDPRRCCSFCHRQGPDSEQETTKTKISVRSPQRQNSISIEDSEIPTENSTSDNNLAASFSSNKNAIAKKPLPMLSLPKVCLTKGNRNNNSSSLTCVAKASTLPESPFDNFTSDPKLSTTPPKLKTDGTNEIQLKSPNSPPTKSEALLERKIRIFSKFLANLGNLSKSVADTDIDNKHKRISRDQKSADVPSSDKKAKSRAVKVSCPAAQSRKSSADFDKLLSLLKTMDLNNKSPDGVKVLNEKYEVSEQCEERLYPVYENKVLLQANDIVDEGQHRGYKPVLYSSSVSLYINAEDKMDTQKDRNDKTDSGSERDKEAATKEHYSNNRSSSQMCFRGVSKEIEDLQLSIQKAKEMRMCASKELHLLQELLSMDATDESNTKEKMSAGVDLNRCEENAVSRSTEVKSNQALSDLREKSKKEVLEDTSFWQEEIQKVKEETKQEWQSKLDRMEARLVNQEEELRRLQSDNNNESTKVDPNCHCRENGRTDSAFEDDEEYARQPSTPIPSARQECDRLQQRLTEEEQRADQLNLMLNQKLIELNKIQITLSKQTKEMIELEKSYLQLQCRLRRGTSKPVVSRLCSRASPFAPKNLCPKPSPPASPQPTNGAI